MADDKGNVVKADLGSTIGIHGDGNITTAVSDDGKSLDIGLKKDVDLGINPLKIRFSRYAPVAQWIEQWFPVPCAGVRFPSGVLPGTYVQFRCVVSQELSETGIVRNLIAAVNEANGNS